MHRHIMHVTRKLTIYGTGTYIKIIAFTIYWIRGQISQTSTCLLCVVVMDGQESNHKLDITATCMLMYMQSQTAHCFYFQLWTIIIGKLRGKKANSEKKEKKPKGKGKGKEFYRKTLCGMLSCYLGRFSHLQLPSCPCRLQWTLC